MRQILKNLATRCGFSLSRRPPSKDIKRVLSLVHPVETNVPLVRLGGERDGGYLVPDDLHGIEACFSPGVDVTATFEHDLVDRGIRCFLADASVERAPFDHPLVDFERRFLGVASDAVYITMDEWVAEKLPAGQGDLILQIDIEGGEWAVLLNMSDALLRRMRIVIVEFHGLNALFDPFGFAIIESCFKRLAKYFHVVHAHPNNALPPFGFGDLMLPYTFELTLLRRDRAAVTGYAATFPHPLDADNVADRPTFALPQAMFRSAP